MSAVTIKALLEITIDLVINLFSTILDGEWGYAILSLLAIVAIGSFVVVYIVYSLIKLVISKIFR